MDIVPNRDETVASPEIPNESRIPVDRLVAWLWIVVAVGLLARLVRYLGCWPLWGDETALAINYATRGYSELARVLDIGQIAPVGFSWCVRTVVLLFGYNEFSLRFVPVIASMLVIPIVWSTARAIRPRWDWVFPPALIAVSYYQIRHAAEVKQYASDTFVTAVLLWLAIAAFGGRRWCRWALVLAVPLAIFSSLPSVFVAGGIGVAALSFVLSARSTSRWIWFFGYNAVVVASFAALYHFVLAAQFSEQGSGMASYWQAGFVDFSSPWAFLWWVGDAMTGAAFAMPFGGKNGGSVLSTFIFLVGVRRLWREGNREFLGVLMMTIVLALIASALHRYPFGGHARLMQYLAPLICIPIGVGIASCIERCVPTASRRQEWAVAVIGFLIVLGLSCVLRDVVRPYHGISARVKRDFARWFWQDYRHRGELRTANNAWRAGYVDITGRSVEYDCFRLLYGADVSVATEAVPDQVSGPVGLVIETVSPETDAASIARWHADLAGRFTIIAHERFPVNMAHNSLSEYHVIWVEPIDAVPP